MFPVLLRIGPMRFYTYGVFIVVGMIASLFVMWKRGRELHFDEKQLFDAVFSMGLWVLVVSRLTYILLHWPQFGFDVLSWLNIAGQPGFEWSGGLIGLLFGAVRQSGERRWDVFSLLDVMVTALAILQVFLGLGAFFNGSGIGLPTSFLGVQFPGLLDQRHPVQLYEAFLYLLLFVMLWWLEYVYRTIAWYKGRRSEAQSGFLFCIYLIGYGLIAFATSLLRDSSGLVGGLWIISLIRIGWALTGVWLLYSRAGTRIAWAEVLRESVNKQLVLPLKRWRRNMRGRGE